ncbi:MAG: hypothetical protein IJL87_08795 [Clostridia bacterium]|nr:hypothetical protein [Clostridia bacterium]
MACFLAPVTEAIVTTIVTKVIEKKEKKSETVMVNLDGNHFENAEKIPFSRKLKWLNNMLWGGSALLAFEHVWHGEVTPWFPFLTAASNPADASEMLYEIATAGVGMAVIVTLAWLGILAVCSVIEKRAQKALPSES